MRKIFGRIPPVGNPIALKTSEQNPEFTESLKTYFLNSGTAALAASLQIAQKYCTAKNPEVIIPAYCCPDLLSAIYYSGMKPVLVDLEPSRPHVDLKSLSKALNENTVAIIAVNFLGIPERLKEIREKLLGLPTVLIEDSAQWFPESSERASLHQGDMVIYSFGRGKPVSILTGGALQIRNKILLDAAPSIEPEKEPNTLLKITKATGYNLMISRHLYWMLELLPWMELGQTKYHKLTALHTLAASAIGQLPPNIAAYYTRQQSAQDLIMQGLINYKDLALDLPASCPGNQVMRLLRYPILFHSETRLQSFVSQANKQGLGVSRMYRNILPCIEGVPKNLDASGAFPHATNFAKKLVTLPVHANVDAKIIDNIFRLMQQQQKVATKTNGLAS